MTTEKFDLTRDQAKTIAAGLYQIASADGFDDSGSERALLLSFLEEAGYPEFGKDLASLPFDPATAYTVLDTSWLRRIFLQAAVIMVRADGKITDAEHEMLSWIANAFGVAGGVDALLADTAAASF
jgi:hypothetical protein